MRLSLGLVNCLKLKINRILRWSLGALLLIFISDQNSIPVHKSLTACAV
jgi:hypothetical protein